MTLGELVAQWPSIVGPLASTLRLVEYARSGLLTVRSTRALARGELKPMSDHLLSLLPGAIDGVTPRGVRFLPPEINGPYQPPSKKRGTP